MGFVREFLSERGSSPSRCRCIFRRNLMWKHDKRNEMVRGDLPSVRREKGKASWINFTSCSFSTCSASFEAEGLCSTNFSPFMDSMTLTLNGESGIRHQLLTNIQSKYCRTHPEVGQSYQRGRQRRSQDSSSGKIHWGLSEGTVVGGTLTCNPASFLCCVWLITIS